MDATIEKFKIWPRNSWLYWVYAKFMFTIQPLLDDAFEATQIVDNLWVGDRRSCCNKKSLIDHNIQMIVSAVQGAVAHHPFSFNYEKANLVDVDGENILNDIERLLPQIRRSIQEKQGVLVHCMQGASRSATIVAAYLIKYHRMGADEALDFMREKRSLVNPNQGYRDQLYEFENRVRQEEEEYGKLKKEN